MQTELILGESGKAPVCAVVMPAYNEQDCIGKVVSEWTAHMRDAIGAFVLIVVDDGSGDSTPGILDGLRAGMPELVVIHKPNGGHGSALMQGYRAAISSGAEFVFQTDSDDQFAPGDFDRLWERRGDSRFILGWRVERQDAGHRLFITRLLRLMTRLMFGADACDVNIPFRLMRTAYLAALLRALPGGVFAPNIFLALLAGVDGCNLMNIPVRHLDRKTGKVSIVRWRLVKACLRSVTELFSFRLNLRRSARTLRSERHGTGE